MSLAINRSIMREANKQARKPGREYISVSQRKALIIAVGDSGALLYHHYYDKAGYQGYDFLDDRANAKALGWSTRKVQRERLKLTKAGWVFKKVYGGSEGYFHLTILGKEQIESYIHNNPIDMTEAMAAAKGLEEGDIGKVIGKKG